ncbi:MAG: TOBE-like domain-containing protein, partial [Actinomycetota bacterium]|nr:TOBE-like domain-containing protein [Actinomycetota bacterium]
FGPMSQVMSLPDDDWTARFLGVEMPLSGRVLSSSGGMMSIGVGEIEIAAVGDMEPGCAVLVSIPPEDVILLAPDEVPFLSSARNRFDATVDAVDPRGATMRLTLQLGGALIAATVSRTSFEEMGLAEGSRLGVLFKATAVRVRPVSAESA